MQFFGAAAYILKVAALRGVVAVVDKLAVEVGCSAQLRERIPLAFVVDSVKRAAVNCPCVDAQ